MLLWKKDELNMVCFGDCIFCSGKFSGIIAIKEDEVTDAWYACCKHV